MLSAQCSVVAGTRALRHPVKLLGRRGAQSVPVFAVDHSQAWRRLILLLGRWLGAVVLAVRLVLDVIHEVVVVSFLRILSMVYFKLRPLPPLFGIGRAAAFLDR